jgi:gamma-F420-2:alpha-L-glutamate ligase
MSPKLHIIINDKTTQSSPESYELLLKAAKEQGVEVVTHESTKIDFTKLPTMQAGDFLYRKSIDPLSYRLETLLINDDLVTFYSGQPTLIQRCRASWSNAITMQRAGIPIIPTIFHVELNDQAALSQAVDALGGFPIVIKSSGEAHGNGVFKFDSLESLWSSRPLLTDAATSGKIVLRRYIKHDYHARLIVLGDKVIDSIEYIAPKNDFRTNNLDKPLVKPRKFSEEIENMAIESTRALNREFAGVDVLVDANTGQNYIAEVNFPCNFSRCQLLTGIDIAGMMVSHLKQKQERKG